MQIKQNVNVHPLHANAFIIVCIKMALFTVVNRHLSTIINGNKLNSVESGTCSLTTYHRHKPLATSVRVSQYEIHFTNT